MRILALGGPGAMGAVAVRLAARLPRVDEIVIADRDGAAAHRLCGQLAEAPVRVSAAQVDVTDEVALCRRLDRADLVVNTVGPYYRFGVPVLRAAIATGTHYVDICDDWEPTVQMLELDETARAADVCAVIGMGASPGVSNLLVATAAAELDTVRDAYTAWPVDVSGTGGDGGEVLLGPDGRPSAAAVHWMLQSSGKICTVRGGQLTFERPLRAVGLTLPGGRRGTAYTVGQPEPITLRRTLGLTGEAVNLMVMRPQTLAYLDVLRRDTDRRRLTHETAALQFAKPNLLRYLRSVPLSWRSKGPGALPPFFAAVSGTRAGRDHIVLTHLDLSGTAAGLFGDMARATGIPLALGLAQIVDGTARRPGVHPPDAVIDAPRFFADLARQLDRPDGRPFVIVEQDERA